MSRVARLKRSPADLIAADRPRIVVTHMDLAVGTKQALHAIERANDPPHLFLLGDTPVRIESHPDGRPLTRELTTDRVVNELSNCVEWIKIAENGTECPALPSVPVARNILASPELPFPPLDRIVEVPVFGRDGSLSVTPGYHQRARLLYQPTLNLSIPRIAPAPTATQIAAARELICGELLGDFPFVGDSERAHAVALLLLPFVRDLIDGPTPLHVIEKPTPGMGGTLLADVLLRPALGRPVPTMTAGRDADEMRKRLTAVLSETPLVVLFDNVQELASSDLSAVLTANTWKDRPLGHTRIVQLPLRCAWVVTSNNPVLTYEITRRTVRIRLDAGVDRPWLRTGFRHPELTEWAMAHRAELVAAALTLVQGWLSQGRPPAAHARMGSFESWAAVMAGILATAGIPGFLGNLETFYDHVIDAETGLSRALVAVWWQRYQGAVVGVQAVWELTQGDGAVTVDLGDRGVRSERTRLGKLLGRMRDRIIAGFRVTAAGLSHGAQQWRLVPITERPQPTEPLPVNVENVGDVVSPLINSTPEIFEGEGKRSPRSPRSPERTGRRTAQRPPAVRASGPTGDPKDPTDPSPATVADSNSATDVRLPAVTAKTMEEIRAREAHTAAELARVGGPVDRCWCTGCSSRFPVPTDERIASRVETGATLGPRDAPVDPLDALDEAPTEMDTWTDDEQ